MNKQLGAATVAIVAALGAGVAHAQSGTGTAALAGNVAGYCDLTIDTASNGASVDVNDVLYGFDSVVIYVDVACNDYDGAVISAASNNKGLQLDDDTSVLIPYDVTVEGFTSGTMDFNSATSATKTEPGSADLSFGKTLTARVSNAGEEATWAGSYDDTLVFSIAAGI